MKFMIVFFIKKSFFYRNVFLIKVQFAIAEMND